MNKIIEQAYKIQGKPYKRELPEVEIGDICKLEDIWDGEVEPQEYDGDNTYSYSYGLTDTDWINYVFEVIEKNENALKETVKIIKIELL